MHLLDSHLSFKGFIDFFKGKELQEKTMKVKYLEFSSNHFDTGSGEITG